MNIHSILKHFFTRHPYRSIHGQNFTDGDDINRLAQMLQAACTTTPAQELAQWCIDNTNSAIECHCSVGNRIRLTLSDLEGEVLFHEYDNIKYFDRDALDDWIERARQVIEERKGAS